MRKDAYPETGGPPGSDPALLEDQLLGTAGVDYAVMIELITGPVPHPDHDVALHAAVNEWFADTWLGPYNDHGRFKGSISLPVDSPDAAVAEVERWADHPHMVQALVPSVPRQHLGHPQYRPIWAAAARHGLPVATHAGYGGGIDNSLSPIGPYRYQVEFKSITYPQAHAAQLVSLVCSGIFDEFEELMFVFVEGGFSWIAPLMWRLENNWTRLRTELPQVRRRPLEYLERNLRFASQPVEEPANPRSVPRLFDLIGADRLLMFSTDYPHYDFDDPTRALPRLTPASRERIMWRNAAELYRLPEQRPSDRTDRL
jgi:predicted TIM-barrel fold metal-dependent hydrolase